MSLFIAVLLSSLETSAQAQLSCESILLNKTIINLDYPDNIREVGLLANSHKKKGNQCTLRDTC